MVNFLKILASLRNGFVQSTAELKAFHIRDVKIQLLIRWVFYG